MEKCNTVSRFVFRSFPLQLDKCAVLRTRTANQLARLNVPIGSPEALGAKVD